MLVVAEVVAPGGGMMIVPDGVRENTRGCIPAAAFPCSLPRILRAFVLDVEAATSCFFSSLPRISETPERSLGFRSRGPRGAGAGTEAA